MSWAVSGQVIYMISQFGILSALTWLGTLADVARFGLAVAITTPIIMFTNLGLRVSLATDANDAYQPNEYYRLRFLTSIAAVPAMLLAGIVATVDHRAVALTIIIGLSKVAESQSDICYGSYQRHSRMDLYAKSQFLRGPFTTLLFIALLWKTGSPVLAFLGQGVWWSLVALFYDQRIAHRISPGRHVAWDSARMWRLARETMPLGFATMIARLANSVPRFVINAFLGLEPLGLFTAVSYVWQAGITAIQQASNSMSGHLSRAHRDGRTAQFWRLILRYSSIFAAGGLAGACLSLWVGDTLLGIAFGEAYRSGKTLLALVFVVLALQSASSVCEMGIMVQRQFAMFARMRFAQVVAALVFCSIGAWWGGIDGVGWGLIAASCVQLSSAVWILRIGQAQAGEHA